MLGYYAMEGTELYNKGDLNLIPGHSRLPKVDHLVVKTIRKRPILVGLSEMK